MRQKQKFAKTKTNHKLGVVALIILAAFLFIPSVRALNINSKDLVSSLNELEESEEISEETQEYIDEVSQEIFEKRERISEINQQKEIYQQNVKEKQQEATSLKKEVNVLDNQIELTSLEISKKETEIEKIKLEMEQIRSEIKEKDEKINSQKDQISALIRQIFKNDKKSYLEIALLNKNFSEFYNEVKYLDSIQSNIKEELYKFKELKHDLKIQEENLSGKRNELDDYKAGLQNEKSDLSQQMDYQEILLDETMSTEAEYEALLEELKEEAQQTQTEISSLEKRARAKLAKENGEEYYGEFSGILAWPTDSRRITCGFHGAGYPYEKWLGPHAGMDIGVSQGSNVYAAGDGYVAIARKLDWKVDSYGHKRPAYNYINIIHNDEISTVYGHLSQVLVTEGDFVTKGQVIGRTGGLPGTAGAGSFSTGAHLHFEVRQVNTNGIPVPVDPAGYLF
ncbi:MAG: peptidoglycan DD-metalloendopeptidase family protein [Patescibacteria group bacterium]|nr:peptidoglycan DD-metalloendopeptidase family protein [Patescibacteria group bacterium]